MRFACAVLISFAMACGGAGAQVAKGADKPIAKDLPPANPQAVSKLVQAAEFGKDPALRKRAIQLLREAIQIDPALWEADTNLGLLLAQDGELKEAETALERAAKRVPDEEDVAIALAEVRRRRGEPKRAAEGLVDFLKRKPDAIPARTVLVSTLRDAGQIERAIVEAREVLVRKPANARALAELGLCHLAKNENETAELLIKQAIDADPKNAAAHRAMGLVLLARGDDALSFHSFQKASSLDPQDTTARLNMGTVLMRAGAYAKAEEQYRAILAVAKDDSAAELGLAGALRGQSDGKNQDKLNEAKKRLEKILDRDPHYAPALFNLGVLLADFLKQPAEAKNMFDKYLSDAPDGDPHLVEAKSYMARLADSKTPAKGDKP